MLIPRFVVSYMHMIDETQTPQAEDDFDAILNMQAIDSAKSFVDLPRDISPIDSDADLNNDALVQQVNQQRQKRRSALTKVAVGAASLAVAVGAGAALSAATEPHFSEETHTYTFSDGEGLEHAAQDIIGVEKININDAEAYIEADPSNIPVFEDGIIKAGETVTVPDQVK